MTFKGKFLDAMKMNSFKRMHKNFKRNIIHRMNSRFFADYTQIKPVAVQMDMKYKNIQLQKMKKRN